MSIKQVIVMRTDLNMRKGKMVAQGAHASLGVLLKGKEYSYDGNKIPCPETEDLLVLPMGSELREWLEGSFVKICVGVGSEAELDEIHKKAVDAGLNVCLITDNGTTEFSGVPTKTCLAIGPHSTNKMDEITGHLRLL
jgi:PTH2 family peptidyl-tRNA hydrolase